MATHVKGIWFDGLQVGTYADESALDDIYDKLLPKAELLPIEDSETGSDWVGSFCNSTNPRKDAEYPVLLSQLQNLEVLTVLTIGYNLRSQFKWTFWYLEKLPRKLETRLQPPDSKLPLSKLRHITFDMPGSAMKVEDLAEVVRTVISLPSMQKLSVYSTPPDLVRDPFLELRPHFEFASSIVERLELNAPGLGLNFLRSLFHACRTLKSFPKGLSMT